MHKYRKYFEAEIGGKVRPFRIGVNSTAMYCDMRGIEKHEFDDQFSNKNFIEDNISPDKWRDLIYCMLKDGELFKSENVDKQYVSDEYSKLNVGHWMDDWTIQQEREFGEKFFTVIASSIIEKVGETEEIKKNSRGQTFLSKLTKRLGLPRMSFGG